MKKGTTFEQAMKRLSEITAQLERGDATLDASLKLFSEGAELLAFCNEKLEDAQLKIETFFPSGEDACDGEV